VVTVVFSVFNYLGTQQAEQATALTRYADKVSYWFTGSGDSEHIEVSNLSNQTIRNVVMMAESLSAEPLSLPVEGSLPKGALGFIELGDVPPCSTNTADALNTARTFLVWNAFNGMILLRQQSNVIPVFFPAMRNTPTRALSVAQAEQKALTFERHNGFNIKLDFLIFTDANGRIWGRDDQGRLVDSSSLIASGIISSQYGFDQNTINASHQISSVSAGCG
jgi:hypothetical protein